MKKSRTILFRLGAVAVLLVICAIMMVIGRGHTVYMDNSAFAYEGETYETPYKIVAFVDGEQVAKLYDGERGMATCIGQNFQMLLEITQEKGGAEELVEVSVKLPYGLDGIIFNLPGYLAGLPVEACISEFKVEVAEPAEDDEEIVTDEFVLGDV